MNYMRAYNINTNTKNIILTIVTAIITFGVFYLWINGN